MENLLKIALEHLEFIEIYNPVSEETKTWVNKNTDSSTGNTVNETYPKEEY